MKDNLGNEEWLRANEPRLKALFPETWTHMSNLSVLQIGYGLKLLGVDWRSQDELANVMTFLTLARFCLLEVPLIKRNPHPLFPPRNPALKELQ